MLKSIVDLFASLILAPAVLALIGGHWTWFRDVDLADASVVLAGQGEAPRYAHQHLAFQPEHAPRSLGTALDTGQALEIALPAALRRFAISLQADAQHAYRVSVSADRETFRDFWVAPGLHTPNAPDEGLVSRTSPVLRADPAARWIRVIPERGRGAASIAGVRAHERRLEVPLRGLALLPWALWLALALLGRSARARGAAHAARRLWRVCDPLVAAVLLCAPLLDLAATPVSGVLTLLALAAVFRAVVLGTRRMAPENVAAAALSIAVALGVAPTLWADAMLSRIARVHDLDVDHRNPPDGDEINSDGARFRGEASDLGDDDFVVLFLGDSFTYGLYLEYEETYPAVVLQSLRALDCSSDVRIVNFGWASASPLLGFRLLRDVGARYRPDLVVYNLDMTDFHDDLRYEEALRAEGGHAFGAGDVLWAALATRAPLLESLWEGFRSRVALRATDGAPPGRPAGPAALPRDRFFATSRPLAASRPLIERGVMRNLSRLHDQARALGAPMLLFVLPRAYQHDADESPNSWERARYEALGPWVLEPFRYFEEIGGALEYPVASLLPAFQNAATYPLYFRNDPHWNRAGAALAGRAAAAQLVAEGLVPCEPARAAP